MIFAWTCTQVVWKCCQICPRWSQERYTGALLVIHLPNKHKPAQITANMTLSWVFSCVLNDAKGYDKSMVVKSPIMKICALKELAQRWVSKFSGSHFMYLDSNLKNFRIYLIFPCSLWHAKAHFRSQSISLDVKNKSGAKLNFFTART